LWFGRFPTTIAAFSPAALHLASYWVKPPMKGTDEQMQIRIAFGCIRRGKKKGLTHPTAKSTRDRIRNQY
jgi:hypothetical protein